MVHDTTRDVFDSHNPHFSNMDLVGRHSVPWQGVSFVVNVSIRTTGVLNVHVEPECIELVVHLKQKKSELTNVMYGHTAPFTCPGYREHGYMRFLMGFVDFLNRLFDVRFCVVIDASYLPGTDDPMSDYLFIHRGYPLYVGYGFAYNGSTDEEENVRWTNKMLTKVHADMVAPLSKRVLEKYRAKSRAWLQKIVDDIVFPFRAAIAVGPWTSDMSMAMDKRYGLDTCASGKSGLFSIGDAKTILHYGHKSLYVFEEDTKSALVSSPTHLRRDVIYFTNIDLTSYWKVYDICSAKINVDDTVTLRDCLRTLSRKSIEYRFITKAYGFTNLPVDYIKYYTKPGVERYAIRPGYTRPPVLIKQ